MYVYDWSDFLYASILDIKNLILFSSFVDKK